MPARAFDFRDDPSGTFLATPEVRARFLRREPGQPEGGFHSHVESGGVEVWVILDGAAKFEFKNGDRIEEVVATAGQAVFAWPDEPHRISCHGDKAVQYFLVVAPHREPTHTHFDKDWNQLPSRNSNAKAVWQGAPGFTPENR
jgi:mannose-6-phosphate isomerase-like protein (cupin superfamily)